MKQKNNINFSQKGISYVGFAVLLITTLFGVLGVTTPSALGITIINTDDGHLDSNWSSTPNVTDNNNDNNGGERDIISAWMDVDNTSPSIYYFRIEVASGPIGSGGTVQIGFDCNNNNVYDEPSDDLILNYWVGYETYDQLSAVWISTPDGIMVKEYTNAYGESVGNNYELRADAADLCDSTPFGVMFKTSFGEDVATPITYPLSSVDLILDDGTSESGSGYLFGSNALQFLWFNRFTPAAVDFPFALDRVDIQWIAEGSGSSIGDAVDVYVWEDVDGDPSNGATFRSSTSGTVQATNGDFSTYIFTPPIIFCNPSDILIGTVDRSVISYTTGSKWPARYDTNSVTSNRSWISTYVNDPGSPPILPSDGQSYEPVDYGTWMIRGHGATVPLSACGIPEITLNFNTGASGSFFTVTGTGFPADSTATITINNHDLDTITTDSNGEFSFILSTNNSDEGSYFVTVSVNPSATTSFSLDSNEPTRPQEGSGSVFDVPAGIAFTEFVFLPTILR